MLLRVMELLRSEKLHTCLVIICALVGFWPYVAGYDDTNLESSILRASLDEQLINRQTSAVALALLVPLILDWMADILGPWFGGAKKHADPVNSLNDLQKGVLLLGLAIAPCVSFVASDFDSLALLWFCLTRFQIVAVLGILHLSFSRFADHHHTWPWWSKLLAVMTLTTGINLTTWTSMQGVNSGPINTLATALKAIALALVVIPSGRWLLRVGYKVFNGKRRKIKPTSTRKTSVSTSTIDNDNAFAEEKLFFPALYVMIGTVCYSIVVMMLLVLGSASQFKPLDLLTYKSAFIIVEVGLLFYYMRKIKYESLYNLSSLIESKKQYLRYVAHEMRTPLNSAVLGLKLMCDSLETVENKGEFDTELSETADDVSKTLSVAVQLLADLMTFNKIEGGLMKLHKQLINVQEHIQDVVDTVAAEAREKGITIELTNYVVKKTTTTTLSRLRRTSFLGTSAGSNAKKQSDIPSRKSGNASLSDMDDVIALTDNDVVFADKFKMDQVLRNLLSNALKFSPRGSVVTVQVGFQSGKAVERVETKITANNPGFFERIFQWWYPSQRQRVVDHNDHDGDPPPPPPQTHQKQHQVVEGTGTGGRSDEIQGELVIVVTDAGAGISKENREQLFQEGMQFNPEILQTGGGSGFGLFISKSIVQLHGGTIKGYSEGEGKGCSFVYKIPMMKKHTMAQNDAALLSRHPAEDEKVDEDEDEIRSAMMPDAPQPHLNNDNNIVPLSPLDVGQVNHHHHHHRPNVASASNNESRNISAQCLSNVQALLSSVPSSAPHVATSIGLVSKDEHSSSAEAEVVRRKEHKAFNTENTLVEAQHALLSEKGITSTITGTTTTAVDTKLHAITEATTNNSSHVSASFSVKKVMVLPPSTESDSGRHEPSLLLVQPQLSSLFEATDGMTGGGGTGTINTPQTLLRSVNQVVTYGHGGAITSSEIVAVESTDDCGVQDPVCSDDKKINSCLSKDSRNASTQQRTISNKTTSPRTIRITKATPQTTTVTRLFHILVVDDSSMSRKMLRRTLVAAGHTCDEAEDGSIAVGMVKDKGLTTYDAILMDFVMPVMDGPSATKAIRALGYIAPIIGCTGNTLDFDVERFKECGCERVIGKPFQLELFHQYMEELTINQRKSD